MTTSPSHDGKQAKACFSFCHSPLFDAPLGGVEFIGGTPFVPTPQDTKARGACQKRRHLAAAPEDFFVFEKIPEPPFDAT